MRAIRVKQPVQPQRQRQARFAAVPLSAAPPASAAALSLLPSSPAAAAPVPGCRSPTPTGQLSAMWKAANGATTCVVTSLGFVASVWALLFLLVGAQAPPLALPQSDLFNASHAAPSLADAQSLIRQSGVDNVTAAAAFVALKFERSNWAGFSVLTDPFYRDLPRNASSVAPGSPIKTEHRTNTSLYTLPANVALSRFIFQSRDLNGTSTPASAFVLWPWQARKFDGIRGVPTVSWGHGTSGWSGECAPSHIRNLWYQYSAPFVLALQGYAVVAPDYSGLGLDHGGANGRIPHQYLAGPAQGNDLIFALQAAQKAFPQLSKEFVVMGHSQGGGAAWAAAQTMAKTPVPGYLGTIAGSPTTTPFLQALTRLSLPTCAYFLGLVAQGVSSVFPSFQLSDWLTHKGVGRIKLLQALNGCQAVSTELFLKQEDIANLKGINSTYYADAFAKLTQTGGLPFAGPMLVLQGTGDEVVPPSTTELAVNQTCAAVKDSQLDYQAFEGVSHVPVLFAGQTVWLKWLADRFRRKPVPHRCRRKLHTPLLDSSSYQFESNYFLEYPVYGYETA